MLIPGQTSSSMAHPYKSFYASFCEISSDLDGFENIFFKSSLNFSSSILVSGSSDKASASLSYFSTIN